MISTWLPVAGYLALILGLSSIATLPVDAGFTYMDKVAHLGEYGILGGLLMRSWARTVPGRPAVWVALTVLMGVTMGALDELWQAGHGRDCSVADWVADAIGVGVAAGVLAWDRSRSGPLSRWWLSEPHAEGRRST